MEKESYTYSENKDTVGVLAKLKAFAKADGRNFANYLSQIFKKHIEDKEEIKE